MWSPWNLSRSPLSPTVPLEGSETVAGLRTIDRLRAAQLLEGHAQDGSKRGVNDRIKNKDGRRKRYRRYKGPFIEFMALEDFQKDPKDWSVFLGIEKSVVGGGRMGDEIRNAMSIYSVPASLDLLCERIDENMVCFLGNYMRMALLILMLTTYLRPKALLGVIALGYNIFSGMKKIRSLNANRNPQERLQERNMNNVDAVVALLTWLLVVYSKCTSIILLAFVLSSMFVLVHASLHTSYSESKWRGKERLSYSFFEVMRGKRGHGGDDPRQVVWDLYRSAWASGLDAGRMTKRWSIYYILVLWDSIKSLCALRWT